MRRLHHSGFSLVEVLVSIVVLSVALLGTAGLMAASLKNTNSAYYRTQATVLADDYFDRMRANLAGVRNNEYGVDAGSQCVSTTGMSGFDCSEWTTMLAQTLPGGVGEVRVTGDGVASIRITWTDGEDPFTFATRSRL